MAQAAPQQPSPDDRENERAGTSDKRTYCAMFRGKDMDFDPMKDLNLPANYEEVMARFRRLQGDRSPDLN